MVKALKSMGIMSLFDGSSDMAGISDQRLAIDLVTSPFVYSATYPGSSLTKSTSCLVCLTGVAESFLSVPTTLWRVVLGEWSGENKPHFSSHSRQRHPRVLECSLSCLAVDCVGCALCFLNPLLSVSGKSP